MTRALDKQVMDLSDAHGWKGQQGWLQAQDLAVPVVVHARREERVDVSDAAASRTFSTSAPAAMNV